MKAPKHHAVLDPPPVLTLPQLVDEQWTTPSPWNTPTEVDTAVETIEEWLPNDKGLLAKADVPILGEPTWAPKPAGLIEMGHLFELSNDLWKPPVYTHTFSGMGGYIAYNPILTDYAAKQVAQSYLEQIEADLMLPSYQIVGQGGPEEINVKVTIPNTAGFIPTQYFTSEWASYDPLSFGTTPSVLGELADLIPALTAFYEDTPCGCKRGTLADDIVHLNDKHAWSREQIADWLDSLDVDLTFQPQSKGD